METALNFGGLTPSEREEASLELPFSPEVFAERLDLLVRSPDSITSLSHPRLILNHMESHPYLARLLRADSRVLESYSIGEHTEMVMRQGIRCAIPGTAAEEVVFPSSAFMLYLSIHDIGKSIPVNKEDQAIGTLEVMNQIRDLLPFRDREFEIASMLVKTNLIGPYIMGFISERASVEVRATISEMARNSREFLFEELENFASLVKLRHSSGSKDDRSVRLERALPVASKFWEISDQMGIESEVIFRLCLRSFVADTSAYNHSASTVEGRRASPGLEYLYKRDPLDPLGTIPKYAYEPEDTYLKGLPQFSSQVEPFIRDLGAVVLKSR